MNLSHLQARRDAQNIRKLRYFARWLRQREGPGQADAEVLECGGVWVVPSGLPRRWRELVAGGGRATSLVGLVLINQLVKPLWEFDKKERRGSLPLGGEQS